MALSDNFISKFNSGLRKCGALTQGANVIVALSGGADSVALLVALSHLGYRCTAAHCNFHLRGEESNRDARYAQDIAQRLGADFRNIDFDVEAYKDANGVSTEMACRELRYEWFGILSDELGGVSVAVAHHRDDNIETMFLNLLRGTGITGLSGMKWRNGIIIRPMLEISRKEIEDYLNEEGINYVIDSTNLVNDVKRNKLRNVILPAIYNEFPNSDSTITTTISNLSENTALYNEAIEVLARPYINGNVIALETMKQCVTNSSTLLFELMRQYGFNHTQTMDMLTAETGRAFYSDTHKALMNRGDIVVNEISQKADEDIEIDLMNTTKLTVEVIDAMCVKFSRDPNVIYLDASALEGNPKFELRRWRVGDRIEPFGMKGSRLVSDVFSDAKLSIDEKANKWLLTRDGQILWIVGMRASRHFPVTGDTEKVLKIKMA